MHLNKESKILIGLGVVAYVIFTSLLYGIYKLIEWIFCEIFFVN